MHALLAAPAVRAPDRARVASWCALRPFARGDVIAMPLFWLVHEIDGKRRAIGVIGRQRRNTWRLVCGRLGALPFSHGPRD